MSRVVHHEYIDPVDQVWLHCAAKIGMHVRRGREDFASWDGKRTLSIAEQELLDGDDCLAQMIFHEICHSLVEGDASFNHEDWGLDNTSTDDFAREHACLRAQAFLADPYGLRKVLAPTTDFRSFYDELPADPLEPRRSDETRLAILAIRRATTAPWAPHLQTALEKTSVMARLVADLSAPGSSAPPLWTQYDEPQALHPGGLPRARGELDAAGCATCAWRFVAGPGKKVDRCRQLDGARIDARWPACRSFEPELDCQQCAACCREAYQSVTVSRRDPAVLKLPELIVDRGNYLEIRRDGDNCAALREEGDSSRQSRFRCTVYDDRPRPCREFERGGPHCLTARRRLGFSL